MSQSGRPASGQLTLQRGGEEIVLAPASDRLTTRLTSPEAVEALRAVVSPVAVRPVARGDRKSVV